MRDAAWRLFRLTGRALRGRDLSLHAAAVTFYGGIAVAPVALLTIWLAGLAAGPDRVRRLTAYPVETIPGAIGADRALAALVEGGLGLTPMLALASLLPATLYGEGLRRAFVSLDDAAGTLVGWRGRLLLLPLLAAAPALLLALLAALPTAARLVGRAAGPPWPGWCSPSWPPGWCSRRW
jgi:membrane protein